MKENEKLWRLKYLSQDTWLGRGTGIGFIIYRGIPAIFGAITAALFLSQRCG
jgi:hypothetical protein